MNQSELRTQKCIQHMQNCENVMKIILKTQDHVKCQTLVKRTQFKKKIIQN